MVGYIAYYFQAILKGEKFKIKRLNFQMIDSHVIRNGYPSPNRQFFSFLTRKSFFLQPLLSVKVSMGKYHFRILIACRAVFRKKSSCMILVEKDNLPQLCRRVQGDLRWYWNFMLKNHKKIRINSDLLATFDQIVGNWTSYKNLTYVKNWGRPASPSWSDVFTHIFLQFFSYKLKRSTATHKP